MRAVTVLTTGGTIAMRGESGAVPSLSAAELLGPVLAGLRRGGHAPPDVSLHDLMNVPGPHLTGADALTIARAATEYARHGRGVVVTGGTDTLEEVAMLCDLQHDGDAPVVFTGAIRPASQPGSDGAANLADAVALAAWPGAAGLGVLVVFGGEVHAARGVIKMDATGPAAFSSPQTGPVGRVIDGQPWIAARPVRQAPVRTGHMDARVETVAAHMGSDGRQLEAAAAACDGVVAVLLGAGHAPPAFQDALERVAAALPVVVTSRVPRGGMLLATYGFRGSEQDVRASGAIAAGMLSPAAARVKLTACLGAGMDRAAIAAAFAADDAHLHQWPILTG